MLINYVSRTWSEIFPASCPDISGIVAKIVLYVSRERIGREILFLGKKC